jgi:hypothetical protein
MVSSVRNFVLVAALAIAGFVAANTAALAQPCTCNIVNGCKVITYYDAAGNITGTETICPSNGTGTFSCDIVETPPTGPLNVSVPPANIDAIAFSPLYGPVHTRFDPTRTSSNATIVSIVPGARYPAQVRFSFYARTDVGGVEYCSRTELVFTGIVNSFNPFQNENFRLESDVEFYDCNDPAQRTVFVLNAGGSNVTLN